MTDAFNKVIAGWEDEGGALQPLVREGRDSAAYFREREAHCLSRAEECGASRARSTYLGFAARYAALARYLETGNGEATATLRAV